MLSYSELASKETDNLALIRFDINNKQHLYMVCLYARIVELSCSIIFLANLKQSVGIPILGRTLLEAYVDLKNLEKNPEYFFTLDAHHLKEWLRVMEEGKDLENPFLEGMADLEGFDVQFREWEAELTQLKVDGPPLSRRQKFKNVGMEAEYCSVYNFWCSDSHNDIRSLQKRHIQQREDNGCLKVVVFTEFEGTDADTVLALCQELLKLAGTAINQTLATGPEVQRC